MTDRDLSHRHRHRKERRARKQADRIATASLRAASGDIDVFCGHGHQEGKEGRSAAKKRGAGMKARTKSQKLADKRRRAQVAGLPELAPIPKRKEQPREGGRFVKVQEDPRKVALNSRCIRFGIAPSQRGRSIVSAQHMCCDLGFVIESSCGNAEVARLWDVFHRWTRAEVTYRSRYLGQGETPASAALMMIHERVETDPSLTVDVRTPDERDRDAVSGWMRWQGFLGHLDADQRTLLHHARRGDGPALWSGSAPTGAGLDALAALRKLADISELKCP